MRLEDFLIKFDKDEEIEDFIPKFLLIPTSFISQVREMERAGFYDAKSLLETENKSFSQRFLEVKRYSVYALAAGMEIERLVGYAFLLSEIYEKLI